MKKYALLFVSLSLCSIFAWSQVKPPLKDEFKADSEIILQERKDVAEQARRDLKETGQRFSSEAQASEEAGTTGLKFIRSSSKRANSKRLFGSLTYSELKSWSDAKHPITCTVINQKLDSSIDDYEFSNYLKVDAGYIADPVFMNGSRTLLLKCGAYTDDETYSLYAFNTQTKRVSRVSKASERILWYSPLSFSTNKRYVAYLTQSGSSLLTICVWDSNTSHSVRIPIKLRQVGQLLWKSPIELCYSQIETRNGLGVPCTYIWDTVRKKSSLFMANAVNPIFSPNKKFVIYATAINPKKAFGAANVHYVVKNLLSDETKPIKASGIGKYEPTRQIIWSPNSDVIFSVDNQANQNIQKIFAFNISTSKSNTWPVIQPESSARLLTVSSKTKRLLLLHQIPLEQNFRGEYNYAFNIESLNTSTGKVKFIFQKKRILALSGDSINFDERLLTD